MKLNQKLQDGYKCFCQNKTADVAGQFVELAKGQTPHSMIICCCDSRVAPETIFSSQPGEIFVLRHVAGIVRPFLENDVGALSAIEFAVLGLKIKNIIVLGHQKCGGIAALLKKAGVNKVGGEYEPLFEKDSVGEWVDDFVPLAKKLAKKIVATGGENLQQQMEQEAVRYSVQNLKAFPYMNEVSVGGAWFDIENAELSVMDSNGAFGKCTT